MTSAGMSRVPGGGAGFHKSHLYACPTAQGKKLDSDKKGGGQSGTWKIRASAQEMTRNTRTSPEGTEGVEPYRLLRHSGKCISLPGIKNLAEI